MNRASLKSTKSRRSSKTRRNGTLKTADLRREARRRLTRLSPERLQVAADFLAYLEEREHNDATLELVRIPGFDRAMKKAEKEIDEGRTINWRRVRSDV